MAYLWAAASAATALGSLTLNKQQE